MIRTARSLAASLALALAAPLAAFPASSAEIGAVTAGDLTISEAWARPNLPDRPTAAYVEITNSGGAPDRLLSATSPAFGRIELHTMEMTDGVMRMIQIEAIPAPAGETVALEPGGLHLMLFDAEERLADGARFPLTLVFERAGAVEIEVGVSRRGPHAEHGGHGSHGNAD